VKLVVEKKASPVQDKMSGKAPSPDLPPQQEDEVEIQSDEYKEDEYKDEDYAEDPKSSHEGLSPSPAKSNLNQNPALEEEEEPALNMEKSPEEIEAQGFLQNFFECPRNYQEVIFQMVKGDQEGLKESSLYMENQDIFNYYLQCIIEFS